MKYKRIFSLMRHLFMVLIDLCTKAIKCSSCIRSIYIHELLLMFLQIRQNDRLVLSKLASGLTKGSVRSPLAQCLLIRYTCQVISELGPNAQTGERPYFDFLKSCLRHKTDTVIFEAACAITELNGVTSRELTVAITVLSTSKPVLRFAAVQTLNKFSSFSYCTLRILALAKPAVAWDLSFEVAMTTRWQSSAAILTMKVWIHWLSVLYPSKNGCEVNFADWNPWELAV